MPSFPYVMEKVRDGFVLRPKIPVAVSYGGNRLEAYGVIDSGSDVTILPSDIAKSLGIALTGKQSDVEGVGGSLKVIVDFVNLSVGGNLLAHATICIPAEDSGLKHFILGHNPLFKEFNITFEYNAKRMVLNRVRH